MKKYFTFQFWDYALERSLKTALQALVASGLLGGSLFGLDWVEILSLTAGTALLSLVTSVLAYKGDGTDNPNDFMIEVDDSYPEIPDDVDAIPPTE